MGRSGEGLERFSKLRSLIIDRNLLTSLETFPQLATLKILSVEGNKLDEFYDTIKYIKQKFPNIQSLNLLSNPLNPKGKSEEYAAFRSRIRSSLDFVGVLDGVDLDRGESETDPVSMLLREAYRKQKDEKKVGPSAADQGAASGAGAASAVVAPGKVAAGKE
jgi:hypothetical protein